MIFRLSIEESYMVAILYDENQRKSWARRAAKGDKTLVIAEEAKEKSLQMLDLAKSKVKLVTRAAGLKDNEYANQANQSSGAAEALSKQVAVAQQAQKQAENAIKSLENRRQSIGKGGGQGQQNYNNNNNNSGGNSNIRGGGGGSNNNRGGGGGSYNNNHHNNSNNNRGNGGYKDHRGGRNNHSGGGRNQNRR